MTREQLLKKLHSLSFCAIPTVETMDMGLEFDFVNSEGAGTVLGAFGEWPAIMLRRIENPQWSLIRDKIKNKTLNPSDIMGTDLEHFANALREFHEDDYYKLSETLAGLLELPVLIGKVFYCRYDLGSWDDKPDFFANESDFLAAFESYYCYYLINWDDMDDGDLEYWFDRIEDEFSEFQYISYSEDEE
mgnify:FL=1